MAIINGAIALVVVFSVLGVLVYSLRPSQAIWDEPQQTVTATPSSGGYGFDENDYGKTTTGRYDSSQMSAYEAAQTAAARERMNKPCAASGPGPTCPPRKQAKKEPQGQTRKEWKETHAKREEPKPKMSWKPFADADRASAAESRAEDNFAEFKRKWAGRSAKEIRREGQKKYHPDRHSGNKEYYQRMSANINAWADELERSGR